MEILFSISVFKLVYFKVPSPLFAIGDATRKKVIGEFGALATVFFKEFLGRFDAAVEGF